MYKFQYINPDNFDTLNHLVKQTTPNSSTIIKQFNKAGLLEIISGNLPLSDAEGQGSVLTFTENINYNARNTQAYIMPTKYLQATYTTNLISVLCPLHKTFRI